MKRQTLAAFLVLSALAAARAGAQPATTQPGITQPAITPPAVTQSAITNTIDADVLRDLPTDDTIFSILETTQPSLISDRISGGGAYTGQAPRIAGFFSSFTQTLYGIGDVSLSDPTGSGAPLLLPQPELWSRIGVTTGLMPVSVNAPGVAIALDPKAPAATWATTLFGTGGFPAPVPESGPPPIDRVDGWTRAGATASGPLLTDAHGEARLSGFFSGSWTRGRDVFRSQPVVSTTSGSVFAHLVFSPGPRNTVHAIGWVQKITSPSDARQPFDEMRSASDDNAAHLQASWEHGASESPRFRLFAAYTDRERTPTAADINEPFERLSQGPVSQLAYVSPSLVRQWTLGARVPALTSGVHSLDGGVEIIGARDRSSAFPQGTVGETVDGIPARLWVFSAPAAAASVRHATTLAAYVADRLTLSPKFIVTAGIRLDAVNGSADGAVGGISWQSWLPRASVEWTIADAWQPKVFAGVSRSAYRLPLDLLAIGDPGAPTASVYQWLSPPGVALDAKALGPLVARVGPGSGGDATFAQIDAALERPTTDELTIGIEAHPARTLRLRAAGFLRRERHLLGLVDTGTPATAFTLSGHPDPGLQLESPIDDQLLPVYNRTPASFGLDRYVLTNPNEDAATSKSIEISTELNTPHVVLFGGASANQSEGPAANVGFGPLENDPDALAEVFVDPNTNTFARGRIFSDRAYTIKISSVLRLPYGVHAGIVARYQDGQPFSRLVIVPELNQGAEAIRAFPNGGSRFTFTETVDTRLQKSFAVGRDSIDVVLDVFNLLNTQNEVEERTVTGATFRTVTAMQPPRTVHAGVRFTF